MCYDFWLVDFWQVDWQHTPISRKIVGKNMHAKILKGNMAYDQHTVPDVLSLSNLLLLLPLAFTNIHVHPWPPVPFFQVSLKNNELKPPTIPFGIVACTFSDNLSRN